MNKKLDEVEEEFIIYYSSKNIAHISITSYSKITLDEFIKYDIPCNECLVQNMCLSIQNRLSHTYLKGSIHLHLCEKIKKFISENKYLFNKITVQSEDSL